MTRKTCRRPLRGGMNFRSESPMRRYPQQKLQRAVQVRAPMTRLEEQHLAYDAQNVPAPFARRNELLNLVREEDQPHLVVVADGREGHHRRYLRGQLPFGLRVGTE